MLERRGNDAKYVSCLMGVVGGGGEEKADSFVDCVHRTMGRFLLGEIGWLDMENYGR